MNKKLCFFITFFVLLTCIAFNGEAQARGRFLTDEQASEWARRLYNGVYDNFVSNITQPIVIIEVRTSRPNSAGGVNPSIRWTNIGTKDIKYITFTVTPYNAVNDPVSSSIGNTSTVPLRITGPCPVNRAWSSISASSWENVWYNQTIDHIRISRIEIIFMDDTTQTISNNEIPNLIMPKEMYERASAYFMSSMTRSLPSTTVREIQTLLTQCGYYNRAINGNIDNATITAANNARERLGLPFPLNGLNESLVFFLKEANTSQ